MEYVVGKSFLRNGERYRPGDKPPGDLDKVTQDHYLRYGMLSAGKPSQTKPAGSGRSTRQPKDKPDETKPAGPAESKDGGAVELSTHGEAGQPTAPSME